MNQWPSDELLDEARRSLEPTARSRWFGVTREGLDKANRDVKAWVASQRAKTPPEHRSIEQILEELKAGPVDGSAEPVPEEDAGWGVSILAEGDITPELRDALDVLADASQRLPSLYRETLLTCLSTARVSELESLLVGPRGQIIEALQRLILVTSGDWERALAMLNLLKMSNGIRTKDSGAGDSR